VNEWNFGNSLGALTMKPLLLNTSVFLMTSLKPTLQEKAAEIKAQVYQRLQTPLETIRHQLDNWEVDNQDLAMFLYKAIPAQCPFERDICLFGKKIAHIPPLCKLNPFYDQLVGLRFRAMCYLADQCGLDLQAL
jgi:hypothetical protein